MPTGRPGAVLARTEHDPIVDAGRCLAIQGSVSEDGRFEFSRTVLLLEREPEGALNQTPTVPLDGSVYLRVLCGSMRV